MKYQNVKWIKYLKYKMDNFVQNMKIIKNVKWTKLSKYEMKCQNVKWTKLSKI